MRGARWFLIPITLTLAIGCVPDARSSSPDTTQNNAPSAPSLGDAAPVHAALLGVLDGDPRLTQQTALTPDDYEALSEKLAGVEGVEATDYTGDALGTIYVKLAAGGTFAYRHIDDDYDTNVFPEGVVEGDQSSPDFNAGWSAPQGTNAGTTSPPANEYATHLPVYSPSPDPAYTSDGAVMCPKEGKIAIVDLQWTSLHKADKSPYPFFLVDGVPLYERIKRMGEAAGFTVDIFEDDEINAASFTKLQDYTVVYTIGHGAPSGPRTTKRLGQSVVVLFTDESYDAKRTMAFGGLYEDAFKRGEIVASLEKTPRVLWTPRLFRDHYRPSVKQHWMLNECFGLVKYGVGLEKVQDKWVPGRDAEKPIFNFGDGLMAAGAKVVFGYTTTASFAAVRELSMKYFRRMFGAYYVGDRPPTAFGAFWPTCMPAKTFFRRPDAPDLDQYAPIEVSFSGIPSTYGMYARDEYLTFRGVCTDGELEQWTLQSYLLKEGTPIVELEKCWSDYWSKGVYPNGVTSPVCALGDAPITRETLTKAQCQVKIARQATNALLSTP
jgi:hypothetical protein